MKNNVPLFSICIPSRDRFEAIKETINSILSQNYSNWEVIISDNSSQNRGRLAAWINSLGSVATKFRVIDAGGTLDMAANWESATLTANGTYVLVVADRWKIRNGALKTFAEIVNLLEPDLFFWPGSKYGQLENQLSSQTVQPPIRISSLTSDEVLYEFVQFEGFQTNSVYGQAIPRALNTGYRREIADRAKEVWGALFRPVSPDYTSAMAFLLMSSSCVKIHEMMYYPIANAGSNFSDSSVLGMRDNLWKYPGCNIWRGLDEDVVFSTVLNDVEDTLKATPKGREWISAFNIENIIKSMMSELNFKEFNGSLLPIKRIRHAIYELGLREGLSDQQIEGIKAYVKGSQHRFLAARKVLRSLGLFDLTLSLNNRLRHEKRKLKSVDFFASEDTSSRGILIDK